VVSILLCACEGFEPPTMSEKLPKNTVCTASSEYDKNELYNDMMAMLRFDRLSTPISSLYDSPEAIKSNELDCFPKTYDDYEVFIDKNKEMLKKSMKYFESYLISFQDEEFRKLGSVYRIEDFQNDNRKKDCSYMIARNPDKKRLVVSFRGSYTIRDWVTDFTIFTDTWDYEKIEDTVNNVDPTVKKELIEKKITIHGGFAKYMFQKRPGGKMSTFEMIEEKLTELMKKKENKDYELYITGHSLGGALATLAGLFLAVSDTFPLPIKVITFASPQPGHGDLADAIEKLGDMGRMYHFRVTNNNDYVPQMSIFSSIWSVITFEQFITFKEGFRHSGVHLNLYEDRKPTLSQTIIHTTSRHANEMTFSPKIWKAGYGYHYLVEAYQPRIDKPNTLELLQGKTWETLKKIRVQMRKDDKEIID